MARPLMMVVTGGTVPSYHKLVSVENPEQFIGYMRAKALKDQIDKLSSEPALPEDDQANILRTLKVKLYDVGLDEYPETDTEVKEVYRRFDARIP